LKGDEVYEKMAELIYNTPAGDSFAFLAARCRGEKDASGQLIVKDSDFQPGPSWKRNF
jgi:hypothetical protein